MNPGNLWFTRAALRADTPDVAPLLNTLLNDRGDGERLNSSHRLLWTLMPQDVQQSARTEPGRGNAAFLWREAPERRSSSTWYVLGPKPRSDAAFFDVETKPWSPSFERGDHLAFDLVVNATVDRMIAPSKGRAGRQRSDVVMDAVHAAERSSSEKEPRALLRKTLAERSISEWWAAQGARNGFRPVSLSLVDYRNARLGSGKGRFRGAAQIGICRITGVIEVQEGEAFAARVARGFGRAKAFGCGLMLLKRA